MGRRVRFRTARGRRCGIRDLLSTSDAQEAGWAARQVYEALDLWVTTRDNIDVDAVGADDRIVAHPLIQAELSRQRREIEELGERNIERIKDQLERFEQGELSLHQRIAGVEALLGLLLDEADSEWVGELEAECNRLEFANAASINGQREPSEEEVAEISDAIQQMRLILTRY